jgi:protein kinase C substrate 80K-H
MVSAVWKIDEYIPDALYDSWETVRDLAIEWMIRLGIIGKGAKSSGATTADAPRK